MKLLITSPIALAAVGGPATVARELSAAYAATGDEVRVLTPTALELELPIGVRQLSLLIRAIPDVFWSDAVLMLDPVTTGPAIAPLAKLLRKRSVLRIGGDILWESYVNRVREPVVLSAFYDEPRMLTLRERLIRIATHLTLRLTDRVVFSTSWLTDIWETPYELAGKQVSVIENGLPVREEESVLPSENVFLAVSRGPYLKNGDLLARVWAEIAVHHPDAVLDTTPRAPALYRRALRDAYALVLPSVSDVSPNAVLEAIAYGIPFITTKDTGLYEAYKDAGIFIDTRDPAALAAALESLLDPAAYAVARERVQGYARTRSWAEVAEEFRLVLQVS